MFDYMGDDKIICKTIEKAIPKKPLLAFANSISVNGKAIQKTILVCPTCRTSDLKFGKAIQSGSKQCPFCKQLIDWSDSNESS